MALSYWRNDFRRVRLKPCLLCFAALLTVTCARDAAAATIIGPSNLLNTAAANQLEAWLGEGNIEITRIYAKAAGDTSADFHAAVDGKGRTFSIIQLPEQWALDWSSGWSVHLQQQIIGGYNPQSWNSTHTYNVTPADIDRTAFLFNLTSGEIQRQNLIGQGYNVGEYQTFNGTIYGPTFGGGHDITVDQTLNYGRAYNYSYGGVSGVDNIVIGGGYLTQNLQYGQIEVFAISNVTGTAAVPEPATLSMFAIGAMGAVLAARRSRRQAALERRSKQQPSFGCLDLGLHA